MPKTNAMPTHVVDVNLAPTPESAATFLEAGAQPLLNPANSVREDIPDVEWQNVALNMLGIVLTAMAMWGQGLEGGVLFNEEAEDYVSQVVNLVLTAIVIYTAFMGKYNLVRYFNTSTFLGLRQLGLEDVKEVIYPNRWTRYTTLHLLNWLLTINISMEFASLSTTSFEQTEQRIQNHYADNHFLKILASAMSQTAVMLAFSSAAFFANLGFRYVHPGAIGFAKRFFNFLNRTSAQKEFNYEFQNKVRQLMNDYLREVNYLQVDWDVENSAENTLLNIYVAALEKVLRAADSYDIEHHPEILQWEIQRFKMLWQILQRPLLVDLSHISKPGNPDFFIDQKLIALQNALKAADIACRFVHTPAQAVVRDQQQAQLQKIASQKIQPYLQKISNNALSNALCVLPSNPIDVISVSPLRLMLTHGISLAATAAACWGLYNFRDMETDAAERTRLTPILPLLKEMSFVSMIALTTSSVYPLFEQLLSRHQPTLHILNGEKKFKILPMQVWVFGKSAFIFIVGGTPNAFQAYLARENTAQIIVSMYSSAVVEARPTIELNKQKEEQKVFLKKPALEFHKTVLTQLEMATPPPNNLPSRSALVKNSLRNFIFGNSSTATNPRATQAKNITLRLT